MLTSSVPASGTSRATPGWGLLIGVLLMVLLAVLVADRIVGHVAESRLSERITCKLGPSAKTSVSISGLLKSPGLLTGSLGRVTVDAHEVPVSGTSAEVNVAVTDVRMERSGSGSRISTGPGTASAIVGFEGLSQALAANSGKAVMIGAYGNSLAVSAADPSQGIGGQAAVLMQVGVDATSIILTPTGVAIGAAQVPIDLARSLLSARNPELAQNLQERRIPLPNLPAAVSLTSASVAADGLTIGARFAPGTLQLAGDAAGKTADCAGTGGSQG